MELDETTWDDLPPNYDAPIGPPFVLLWFALVSFIVALGLTVPSATGSRLAGYVLAAVVTTSVVALFRYVDSRRRSLATYRISPMSGRLSIALLTAAWLLSCVDAWLLATGWSR